MSDTPTKAKPEQAQARDYRKTLNLPATAFPMRASLVQNEPASIRRWAEMGLYQRLRKAGREREAFVFHDGPPYANGSLHLGHLLNRTLKDFVVRTRSMMGMDCPYIPGWDCHGLPIEHKVMSEMHASGKLSRLAELPEDTRRMAIRKACAAYAEKYIKLQKEQMQQLLTLADYDDPRQSQDQQEEETAGAPAAKTRDRGPYRTMDREYEAAVLELFADLVEKGLVYRALKSVHWSIENQTALAEAELEYYDRQDESVYVEFEAEDAQAVARTFGLDAGALDRKPTFMIWTTTPWTLPANLAIAVKPDAEYALLDLGGSLTVVALDLVARIAKAGDSDAKVIARTPGQKLVGLQYAHPLIPDRDVFRAQLNARDPSLGDWTPWRIVPAPHVTLDDGTGLVHTAPGHGREDELIGRAHYLPIYCPVREDGTYDDSVSESLRGLLVWDANPRIVKTLRESGHLYHSETITHSYPHDWRGKSPVIFRATRQWFIRVDPWPGQEEERGTPNLRRLALDATAGDIEFIPRWGQSRMRGMLESRPDWCISRQRSWGLPIPAFRYKPYEGGDAIEFVCTPRMVRAVASVVREKGSNAWFTLTPAELLRDYTAEDWRADALDGFIFALPKDNPPPYNTELLEKGHDIFDVWFESGSSWRAAMQERGQGVPCDLYLEGSDQHRGWFQVSLLTALGAEGRPPFRALLTHGFMVDKDGKAMSKSVGNTLEVADLLRDFGADVCRWWVASLSYESDIKADVDFFKTAGESYRKVRNTLRFMLGNLGDFKPTHSGNAQARGRDARATREEGHGVALADFPAVSLDAWILSRFAEIAREVHSAFDAYNFRAAHQSLYNFCNEDLSAIYLAAVKDRLYCDAPGSERRRRTQTALWDLADGLCRLLAPLIPHTADEAFRALPGAGADGAETTVHLKMFPDPAAIDAPVDGAWPAVMRARDAALAALERKRETGELDNPLDASVVLPGADGALSQFDEADLADLLGVSRVRLDAGATEPVVEDLRAEPRCERCWRRHESCSARSDGALLCDRCAAALGDA